MDLRGGRAEPVRASVVPAEGIPMDMSLLSIAGAFGLAASAGLNTTLPLLVIGLLARGGLLALGAPFDALGSDVAIVGLGLLALIELVGDKVPVVDSVVHAIQWPLAATAGAILFASQTSSVTWVHPGLAIVVGVLTAGGVHALRSAVRPAVTTMTLGAGNAVVSLVEDVVAVGLVLLSVLAPLLALLALLGLVVLVVTRGPRLARRGAGLAR